MNLFVALAVVLALACLFGMIARRLGQPPVVGEILAGILLSATVLPASVGHYLVPIGAKPLLSALANVGLATFMFIVGYEIDSVLLRGRVRKAAGLAAGSVLVPLISGILLALLLADRYAEDDHLAFVLFVGVAMSVTALPVLSRILAETGLDRLPIGAVTLTAAAIGDVIAWGCLAAVTAVAGGSGQWHAALLPVYALILFGIVRPVMGRLLISAQANGQPTATLLPILAVGLTLSCAATEWLGFHFIFGAFAFGVVLPRTGLERIRGIVIDRMDGAGALLVPLYFVLAGMNVTLAQFDLTALAVLVAVVAIATGSKALGAYLGSRLSGATRSDALVFSVLMNTRGMTEIVILTVGLDLQLMDRTLYSMMVLMAVLTTAMTGPLLTSLRKYLPGAATWTMLNAKQEQLRTKRGRSEDAIPYGSL
ncbi:MAG: cation:proton antiporter [Jatrophihabitantaceae bacterium]